MAVPKLGDWVWIMRRDMPDAIDAFVIYRFGLNLRTPKLHWIKADLIAHSIGRAFAMVSVTGLIAATFEFGLRMLTLRGLARAGNNQLVDDELELLNAALQVYVDHAGLILVGYLLVLVLATAVVHRRRGHWQNSEFVYREPRQLFRRRMSGADINFSQLIKIRGAPRNAFVHYRVEVQPDNPNWYVVLLNEPKGFDALPSEGGRPKAHWRTANTRLDGHQTTLFAKGVSLADAVTITVWMESWKADDPNQENLPLFSTP